MMFTDDFRRTSLLVTLFVLGLPMAVRAQSGPELLLNPFRPDDQLEINTDWLIGLPTQTDATNPLTGSDFDARIDATRLSGRIRLTPGQSTEGLARTQPRAGFDIRAIQLDTLDPDVPGRMLDVSAALGIGVLAYDDWLGGLTFGIGNANADGQNDANALYATANFAIGKSFGGQDVDGDGEDDLQPTRRFGIVINYDGNRTFLPDVPLPGFQYASRFNNDIGFALGFPFSGLTYERGPVRLDVEYLIPFEFNARAEWFFMGDLGLYAAYTGQTVATHWGDLDRGQDRIFLRRRLAEAGFAYDATDGDFIAVIAVGYAFDQELETGWDTRDTRRLAEFDDHVYFRTSFELRL
jgi:hypothetical protein